MIEAIPAFASARLLAYSGEEAAAFPEHCTVALVEAPTVFAVPGAPSYCAGLMEWSGELVPLVDLNAFAQRRGTEHGGIPTHVLVVAWQQAPGEALQYGAVYAPTLATAVRVSDDQQCDPPHEHALTSVAAAFFDRDGHAVPIIDTRRLFGR
jgi:chemotaxis signal transduction protein